MRTGEAGGRAAQRIEGDLPRRGLPRDPAGGDTGGSPRASRQRVLEVLRSSPEGIGIADLAARVGLHMNTVRFHLDRLVAEGLATRSAEQRSQPGRPRLTFTGVPRPDVRQDQRSYHLLAEMLAGYLSTALTDPAGQSLQIGQTWGGYLTPRPAPYRRFTEEESLAELLHMLDTVGFAPAATSEDAGWRIDLRHCPFLEVAEAHRDVVCSLHLGLMRGALAELRAPIGADRLVPFAEPSACVAHLSTATAPAPQA